MDTWRKWERKKREKNKKITQNAEIKMKKKKYGYLDGEGEKKMADVIQKGEKSKSQINAEIKMNKEKT